MKRSGALRAIVGFCLAGAAMLAAARSIAGSMSPRPPRPVLQRVPTATESTPPPHPAAPGAK